LASASAINPCPGDTRGDRRCNHDDTHRVCAEIGLPDTSFWTSTGQRNWCNTVGGYSRYDSSMRCPYGQSGVDDAPTWCICLWATADWINHEYTNGAEGFCGPGIMFGECCVRGRGAIQWVYEGNACVCVFVCVCLCFFVCVCVVCI
jgi:hypothetical protein